MAAKAMEPFSAQVTFQIFGADLTFALALPFRWKMFYYMAVSFAIAEALYLWRCPRLIKEFQNFREYRDVHPGIIELVVYFRSMISSRESLGVTPPLLASLLAAAQTSPSEDVRIAAEGLSPTGNEWQMIRSASALLGAMAAEPGGAGLGDVFDGVRRELDEMTPGPRFWTTFFFGLGAVFFAALVADSFISVVKLT